MKLLLITGNKYKLAAARKGLERTGIEIEALKMETPELQSLNSKEIADYSAKFAAEKLQKPVIVTDASWQFEGLNGFPGPFAKFMNNWFSMKDYQRLLKGVKNREAKIIEVVSYCKPGEQPKSFQGSCEGTLSLKPRGKRGFPLDRLFIPKGKSKTSAQMKEKEMTEFWVGMGHWKKLAKFMKEEKNGKNQVRYF